MKTLSNVLAKANKYHSTRQHQQDINSARNEDQYRFLALPDSDFRISALLFSDMVFFPTPVTTGTREKLAHALRHQLQAEINASPLRLWMATTAAVGLAPETLSSQYFLHLAATQALRLDISDFGSFESKLCEVLWDTRVEKQTSSASGIELMCITPCESRPGQCPQHVDTTHSGSPSRDSHSSRMSEADDLADRNSMTGRRRPRRLAVAGSCIAILLDTERIGKLWA